jgi:alpha-glucosidase
MRRAFGICLLLVALYSPFALGAENDWHNLPPASAMHEIAGGIEIQAGSSLIRITALSESVARVRVAPRASFGEDRSWAVLPEAFSSPAAFKVRTSAAAFELVLGQGAVRVERSPLRLVFLDAAGKVLTQEVRTMAFAGDSFRLWMAMPSDEHYYGLGDKPGPLDRREQAFTNWNTDAYAWQESTDPLYKSIPFVLTLRHGVSYGIFLDNTWRTSLDFGKAERDVYSFGSEGGELNYYFFFGPTPKQVLSAYTQLVGRMPLPPLWTLGYQQSRYSYYPEARVREIARTLRDHKIPADAIYLDIDYQDGNRPFTIDRKGFPNFEGMVSDLKRDGFQLVVISDLHIKKEVGYQPYDEGLAGDHFVKNSDGSVYVGTVWPGPSVFPDFTREASRRWYGSLYKDFVRMGIGGFWNDMNEPSVFLRDDKTMPLDVVHRLDNGTTASHRAIHNVFGMENVRATYEGLLRVRPDARPFVLTRAAYAGTERYAASWTGDNTSSWNHLRMTNANFLNLGLSGYPLVGADVGGFVGTPPPDLLTRWFEAAAFSPIFRDHTGKGTGDQEPWVHGPEQENIRRRYVELRYRLLPYIYTVAEEASRTGTPIVRPVFLEYPGAEDFYTEAASGFQPQFLFGRDFMVAPRGTEMLDSYDVPLPPGEWYNYWTGERMAGNKKLPIKAKLDELPLFVRGGSIVPQQPLVQNTAETPKGALELLIYPGTDCQGSIYLDDGNTFAYRKGVFLRQSFTCAEDGTRLQVKIEKPEGTYVPWWQEYALSIYGASSGPKRITVDGQPIPTFEYDAEMKKVSFRVPRSGEALQLEIDSAH